MKSPQRPRGILLQLLESGLDVVYPPENANLYDMIAKRLLLSEYALESTFKIPFSIP